MDIAEPGRPVEAERAIGGGEFRIGERQIGCDREIAENAGGGEERQEQCRGMR